MGPEGFSTLPHSTASKLANTRLGLGDLVRAQAGGADFDALDAVAFANPHVLQVRFERTFDVLDQLQTNAAFLLRQTTVGNAATDRLALTTNVTDS